MKKEHLVCNRCSGEPCELIVHGGMGMDPSEVDCPFGEDARWRRADDEEPRKDHL